MYRARVQAVSGSKVFADGKWLRCIGNKPVSVGERVWTDGRVVYGHYTIPQTPLIITPQQEDIVIPIVTTKNFYVFSKGKLKTVTPPEFTPLPDKLFVSNKKAQCYFINDYLFRISQAVYTETDNWGKHFESNNYWISKGTLAANVDKEGNLFTIILDTGNLLIKKNDKTVKEFNLQNLGREVFNSVEQPSHPDFLEVPDTDEFHQPTGEVDHYGEIGVDIYHIFIENENNFAVFVCFYAEKDSTVGQNYSYSNVNAVNRHYYISNNGIEQDADSPFSYVADTSIGPSYIPPDGSVTGFDAVFLIYTEFNPDKKNPLQDGYYFKRKLIARQLTAETFTTHEERTVYSPDDTKIFTGLFPMNSKIIFTKVKSDYLMGVINDYDSYFHLYLHRQPNNLQTIMGLPFFRDGIFLFSSGNWKLLTEDYSTKAIHSYKDLFPDEICLNQNLQPMKYKKNWQNRIKTISFED